jgi:hypothetical protein
MTRKIGILRCPKCRQPTSELYPEFLRDGKHEDHEDGTPRYLCLKCLEEK